MKTRFAILSFSLFFVFISGVHAKEREILVIPVSGSINPGIADFILAGIDSATEENTACVIIELDTPGGLAESMREIVKGIYASKVPVVVFVTPQGARAASAGVMITIAADVAVMAPGTNIGAAHPVGAGGKDIDDTMKKKVSNDMAAYVRSIAAKRNRNPEWAEKAVRESVSATAEEALEENVIDFIARDRAELIEKLRGREVSERGKIDLKGAVIRIYEESLRTKILKTIGDPNIAYILMMIGLAGIYFEISHPGVVLPGVIGAISLVLAFFAFQTLPVNYAGILLILLAILFFILEMKVTSYGLLSFAGILSLFLGSMMLYEGNNPEMAVSIHVFLPTIFIISTFFVIVAGLVFRSQTAKPRTGSIGIIGEIGLAKTDIQPEGKVFVHGEWWKVHSKNPIKKGEKVRVTGIDGLLLDVEKADLPGNSNN